MACGSPLAEFCHLATSPLEARLPPLARPFFGSKPPRPAGGSLGNRQGDARRARGCAPPPSAATGVSSGPQRPVGGSWSRGTWTTRARRGWMWPWPWTSSWRRREALRRGGPGLRGRGPQAGGGGCPGAGPFGAGGPVPGRHCPGAGGRSGGGNPPGRARLEGASEGACGSL